MRPDIKVGATFPDYELTDHTGTRRKLSDLQGNDPIILILSRGHFCPKDHRQMMNYVAFYPELKVGYTRIVTITTDNIILTNEMRDKLGAQWPFLSDPGRKVQKDLDIQEYTETHNDPMIPHTFVLEPGLKIFKIYKGISVLLLIRLTPPRMKGAWMASRGFRSRSDGLTGGASTPVL